MTCYLEVIKSVLEKWPEVRLGVLFGSVASGKDRTESDVDVGVVLADKISSMTASTIEVELERALNRTVQTTVLHDASPLLRFEVARNGIVALERTPYLWADFRAKAMLDWWDWEPTARKMHQVVMNRLKGQVNRGPT